VAAWLYEVKYLCGYYRLVLTDRERPRGTNSLKLGNARPSAGWTLANDSPPQASSSSRYWLCQSVEYDCPECQMGILSPQSLSEIVKRQARDMSDSGEILVEREDAGAMLESNSCNQGVDRGERDPSRIRGTINVSCVAVGLKSSGLDQSHCARYCSIALASFVRPCKTSAITTPVRAKDSASSIIRRSSAPARPGEELKKSTHTVCALCESSLHRSRY